MLAVHDKTEYRVLYKDLEAFIRDSQESEKAFSQFLKKNAKVEDKHDIDGKRRNHRS
jgi:hypothetical protein